LITIPQSMAKAVSALPDDVSLRDLKDGTADAIGFLMSKVSAGVPPHMVGYLQAEAIDVLCREYAAFASGLPSTWSGTRTETGPATARGRKIVLEFIHDASLRVMNEGNDYDQTIAAMIGVLCQATTPDDQVETLSSAIFKAMRRYRPGEDQAQLPFMAGSHIVN